VVLVVNHRYVRRLLEVALLVHLEVLVVMVVANVVPVAVELEEVLDLTLSAIL
jgi:hypothetical protein